MIELLRPALLALAAVAVLTTARRLKGRPGLVVATLLLILVYEVIAFIDWRRVRGSGETPLIAYALTGCVPLLVSAMLADRWAEATDRAFQLIVLAGVYAAVHIASIVLGLYVLAGLLPPAWRV